MPERLFVYGTLRTGERNHGIARGLGLVATQRAVASGLDLFHLEPEGYPAVVSGSGVVHGEVLALDRGLDRLDRLEGVDRPDPRYARVRRAVEVGAERAEVWIYLYLRIDRLERPGAIQIAHGDWVAR